MKRYYYIGNNLESLRSFETDLENNGFTLPQIHILTENDAEAQLKHLHEVESVLRKDVVRGTQWGAVFGAVLAAIVLIVAVMTGITASVGWWPVIFLAIIVLGFCTWEGGLFGIQEPHHQFRKFKDALDAGKHILFVDTYENQGNELKQLAAQHGGVEFLTVERSAPAWVIYCQNQWHRFMETMP